MENCPTCGKSVILRAYRVKVNRKNGVGHYIQHVDGTDACGGPWESVALKPYPKEDADKPWLQLIARWETHCHNARHLP